MSAGPDTGATSLGDLASAERSAARDRPEAHKEVALVELVDRLLDKGVVLAGDVTLSVAGVDLVHVSLRLLVSTTERMEEGRPRR